MLVIIPFTPGSFSVGQEEEEDEGKPLMDGFGIEGKEMRINIRPLTNFCGGSGGEWQPIEVSKGYGLLLMS